MAKTTGWGGSRSGSGRPPTSKQPTEHTSVRLTADTKRYLRKVGNGNVSEGIERMVRRATGQEDELASD